MVRRQDVTNLQNVQGRARGDDERDRDHDGPRPSEHRATSGVVSKKERNASILLSSLFLSSYFVSLYFAY